MSISVPNASEEEDEVKKRKAQKKNKMLSICRELCFFIVTILAVYATILNSQTKTKKGAPSVPFFGSPFVDDFYQGELQQLMHEVSTADYSFIFYYAPWDADCQDLKYEFLEAAEFYKNQIYFAGVNCWEPGSECRTNFKDVVERYPQLVAYIGHEKAITYRGPPRSDHMIKFLHSITHPIIRLNFLYDLWRLRFIHDAVLVGYLGINGPVDTGLTALYETALSLASTDHIRRIAVGVFTHRKFNSHMNVTGTPAIRLYIWSKTLTYEGPLKRSSIYNWLAKVLKGNFISMEGFLSLKPPTVVMFTPLHPISTLNPYYLMFRRIAMTLKSPSINGTDDQDFLSYIFETNKTSIHSNFYQEIVQDEKKTRASCLKSIVTSDYCSVIPKWDNATCASTVIRRTTPRDERDLFVKGRLEEECRILERSAPLPDSLPPAFTPPRAPFNVTFGFASMDSHLFLHLAEALGIDLLSEPQKTITVIIGEEEMVRIKKTDERNIWQALQNWSKGSEERVFVNSLSKPPTLPPLVPKKVFLPELNVPHFTYLLEQNTQHSLILYHSRYCGACGRASHVMLELASLLRDVSCMTIARVDGDKVDLPWHFSLHFFPSLLFLPRLKKSESRLFPSSLPWLFSSVTGFILENLSVEERPEVVVAVCAKWGLHPEESFEGSECIREARKVSVEGIESKLRQVRRRRDRKSLLVHLGFLKSVHLVLARVTNVQDTLNVIKSLSKQYRIGCSVT